MCMFVVSCACLLLMGMWLVTSYTTHFLSPNLPLLPCQPPFLASNARRRGVIPSLFFSLTSITRRRGTRYVSIIKNQYWLITPPPPIPPPSLQMRVGGVIFSLHPPHFPSSLQRRSSPHLPLPSKTSMYARFKGGCCLTPRPSQPPSFTFKDEHVCSFSRVAVVVYHPHTSQSTYAHFEGD